MKILFPEIEWTAVGTHCSGGWKGTTTDHIIETRRNLTTDKWTVIVNGKAINSGSGPYGYYFSTPEEAKHAAQEYVNNDITIRVMQAAALIARYTRQPEPDTALVAR